SGQARYYGIDVSSTAAGASVAFNDSGTNVYGNTFEVSLNNAASGDVTFNGRSNFGASSLMVFTTYVIIVNDGAVLTSTSGGFSFGANGQLTPTHGNFRGVSVFGSIQSTGSGDILLSGRGGDANTNGVGQAIRKDGLFITGSISTASGKIAL